MVATEKSNTTVGRDGYKSEALPFEMYDFLGMVIFKIPKKFSSYNCLNLSF
jgi:hypothetical protein